MILARSLASAIALVVPVGPERLAGRAVDGDDMTTGAGGGVENAVDRERRGLEIELR